MVYLALDFRELSKGRVRRGSSEDEGVFVDKGNRPALMQPVPLK